MKSALTIFSLGITLLIIASADADIVEYEDVNYIVDVANPSNGLRFLDMSYSSGLTQSAALLNAQATYSDARFATPAEWDDLFDAGDMNYDGSLTASDAFNSGGGFTGISSGANYSARVKEALLNTTSSFATLTIWSDPDGNGSSVTTRDYLEATSFLAIAQTSTSPPFSGAGWLIVSETAAIPEPMSLPFLSAIGMTVLAIRRSRRSM